MPLTVGMPAPDFTLPTDDSGSFTLSQQRGHPVVVYFYPKDNTSGCTKQACDLTEAISSFAKDVKVLGISRDSLASHAKFRAQYNLSFPLATDSDGHVCELYGVWVEKSMYGRKYFGIERSTFLIDSKGVIQAIWRKVKVPGHSEEIRRTLAAL